MTLFVCLNKFVDLSSFILNKVFSYIESEYDDCGISFLEIIQNEYNFMNFEIGNVYEDIKLLNIQEAELIEV